METTLPKTMGILNYLAICLMIFFQACSGQTAPKREIFNKEFRWKITIPENFENVSAFEWERLQRKGKDAIEKTYDATVENHAKTIFVFKADQFNYFESNYQPFDVTKDGDYLSSFRGVNEMIYNTFNAQMPGAKLDSVSSEETIDGLKFNTFNLTIHFPNQMMMNFKMSSRLFDKKEFTVNIMTIDKEKQKTLFDAWKNSKFER